MRHMQIKENVDRRLKKILKEKSGDYSDAFRGFVLCDKKFNRCIVTNHSHRRFNKNLFQM